MALQDRQLKLRRFLDLASREDLIEQATPEGGSKVWAEAPWGVVRINPYLGTVELNFYEQRGVALLDDEHERSRLESIAKDVGAGHWSHEERNAGVRDLNSDF